MSTDLPWKAPAAPGAGPTVRPPSAPPTAPRSVGRRRADALGVSALTVSAVAFLFGWLPLVGLVLGVGGVILSVLAKRQSNRRNYGRIGLIFSLWAVAVNVGMIIFVVVSLVPPASSLPG